MIAATATKKVCPTISRNGAFHEIEGRFGWHGRAWWTQVAYQPVRPAMPGGVRAMARGGA